MFPKHFQVLLLRLLRLFHYGVFDRAIWKALSLTLKLIAHVGDILLFQALLFQAILLSDQDSDRSFRIWFGQRAENNLASVGILGGKEFEELAGEGVSFSSLAK